MVVVDSMRFPIVDGTAPPGTNMSADNQVTIPTQNATTPPTTGNYVYSAQRYQPYRGGHAVPVALPSGG